LNAGEVELLDSPTLTEQLVCLVWRGSRIDHEPNGHDDHANAAAGAVHIVLARIAFRPWLRSSSREALGRSLGSDPQVAYVLL
jgi:hypothetical protein